MLGYILMIFTFGIRMEHGMVLLEVCLAKSRISGRQQRSVEVIVNDMWAHLNFMELLVVGDKLYTTKVAIA